MYFFLFNVFFANGSLFKFFDDLTFRHFSLNQ